MFVGLVLLAGSERATVYQYRTLEVAVLRLYYRVNFSRRDLWVSNLSIQWL